MSRTCQHCTDLITRGVQHPQLRKISELNLSTLYKCKQCHAYLHHHGFAWEVISGGSANSVRDYQEEVSVVTNCESGRPNGLFKAMLQLPRILFNQKD